jgi:hypothetical protein
MALVTWASVISGRIWTATAIDRVQLRYRPNLEADALQTHPQDRRTIETRSGPVMARRASSSEALLLPCILGGVARSRMAKRLGNRNEINSSGLGAIEDYLRHYLASEKTETLTRDFKEGRRHSRRNSGSTRSADEDA